MTRRQNVFFTVAILVYRFRGILNMEWHFTHIVAVVRCECVQLFFTGCTISLHFLVYLCPGEILFTEFCHFQFCERIKSYLYFISVWLDEMRFFFRPGISIYIHQKWETFSFLLFFFLFLSFDIKNVGKCNQTVKYSNKRGIINMRRSVSVCALRVFAWSKWMCILYRIFCHYCHISRRRSRPLLFRCT